MNIQSYEYATYWNDKPAKEIVTVAEQQSLQNLVGTSPSELLRKAQKNIDRQFFFIGITELFEESIFLLFDMIGIKETLLWRPGLYSYWRLNKEEMPIKIFKKLSLLIEADLDLYHENRLRLEETLKTTEFGEQLTRYKRDARNPYKRLYGELSERLNIAALTFGLESEAVTNELAHSQAVIHNINIISDNFEKWRESEMGRINANPVNRPTKTFINFVLDALWNRMKNSVR